MLRGESPSPFFPPLFSLSFLPWMSPRSPSPHLSPFSLSLSLSPPPHVPFTPLYEPLAVHSHPTSITAQKFKEPNWPHLSQCWMQMEFLLLREVQLVTPAAPTPSIYCLKAKPAPPPVSTL